MGVAIRRRTVSGPSGVADPALAGHWVLLEEFLQGAYPSGTFPHFQATRLEGSQPGAVIAAVLESP